MRGTHITTLAVLALVATACAGGSASSGADQAEAAMSADRLLERTAELSSDAFEGRGPGTPGEDRTVAWLQDQFAAMGLEPGNPDGTWVQAVDLVGFTADAEARFDVGRTRIGLTFPDDYVAVTRRNTSLVEVENSDLVFVGYGVVAPEYDWDDYKDVDVRGKTIVMLINDPAVPDPYDPTALDPNMFRGEAMTYYGRWTYKYEIATEKGAAAAIIVHETGPAGYPYEVVQGSWARENFDIRQPDGNMGRVAVEAWITSDVARALFGTAGLDFDRLKEAATRRDFQPVAMNATTTFRLRNTVREVASRNVVARLPGRDPAVRDEVVVYTAHWDHLGRDSAREGDQIFNGALDNASGTAGLLEIAEAFTRLPDPPRRSVLFLAVTAEEKGLLGAKYYAEHPLYPLEKTLANINLDGVNQWGPTTDIVVVGYGNSTLDDLLAEVARPRGRTLAPDPEPEKGFFYRSDHFEFAKQGVPALYVDAGTEYIGKPEGFDRAKREEYTANDYHKPSDEVKADWDLSGAVADLRLLFRVGLRVADGDVWPEWKPGTEFRAVRESMLAK